MFKNSESLYCTVVTHNILHQPYLNFKKFLNETRSWIFEKVDKINKINNPLVRLG